MKLSVLAGIFALLVATQGLAQSACRDLFDGKSSRSAIDSSYMTTVAKWQGAWQKNSWHKLTGTKAPLSTSAGFKIEEFLKAREFRTWFEAQSRMKSQLDSPVETVEARVKLMADPHEALRAKLLAIREAKHTIDIAYFIVKNDTTGLAFFNEIKAALQRGVSVRFLIDSMGSVKMTPHSELRALIEFAEREGGTVLDLDGRPTGKRATVEVVVFNPFSSALTNALRGAARLFLNLTSSLTGQDRVDPLAFSLNRRTHDKILLIDGAFEERAIAFIGGRNVADGYYHVQPEGKSGIVDFEIMMKGVSGHGESSRSSVGAQVSEYFDQVYFHLGNKVLTRSLLGMVLGYDKQVAKMEEASRRLEETLNKGDDPESARAALLEDGWSDHKVEIVNTFHNLFREKASRDLELRDHRLHVRNSRALLSKLEQLIANEKQEVVIVSPYLWLSQKQVRLLKSWLLKDPSRRLTLVTNSLMTSNSKLAQLLVDNVLGPSLMLDRGLIGADGRIVRRSIADQVRIYEYGHLDSTVLGGAKDYGMLHAKALHLRSSEATVLGTYNNDPRSLLLNSEGAAAVHGPEISRKFGTEIEKLIADSHLWGSDEYHQIRAHESLPQSKRLLAKLSTQFYQLVLKLNLWWII